MRKTWKTMIMASVMAASLVGCASNPEQSVVKEKNLDKVLEPFYMVDKARTRKNNGTGLGLSICSEICNINNISLDIKSELNVGTEVILAFNKEHFFNEN